MKAWGERILAELTPGVRSVLGLLTAAWLVAVLGQALAGFHLDHWLVLNGPQFWQGELWRLVTYVLLPSGLMDFVMNGLAVVLLGRLLEGHWSRGEFWLYCLVTVAGAGLAKVGLQFSNPLPLTGTGPMAFGLLIGWGFLGGREAIGVFLLGETTVWKLVLVAGAVSLLILFFTAGLVPALIMAAGGLAGFTYLWLKHQWLMSRAGSVVQSKRIRRLEL
jgi:membrane associated rhomboid family serine protease